jgi:Putative zinc-finger
MNCSRFRFLIQQWFDSPLSVQDERMVLAHVEQCDSCARFQHQLDQVIQSAPEVPLPDECLPATLESLAKRIINELPQKKAGLRGIIDAIFPFFSKVSVPSGKSKGQPVAKEKPFVVRTGHVPARAQTRHAGTHG